MDLLEQATNNPLRVLRRLRVLGYDVAILMTPDADCGPNAPEYTVTITRDNRLVGYGGDANFTAATRGAIAGLLASEPLH